MRTIKRGLALLAALLVFAFMAVSLTGCGDLGYMIDSATGNDSGVVSSSDVNNGNSNSKKTANTVDYCFRNSSLLKEHYYKHGIEMGFSSAEDYEQAASDVVNNPSALHKYEAEDGDDVYYVESTNDFVIVSTDGYIRTYFRPDSGKSYFDRQ